MKESNIPADNMKIKQLMKFILLTRKWQYMKESNILTGNATIKELERVVLLNRKGQYINDWIILTDNYESGKNSLMSIVITCKSIIGIIFSTSVRPTALKKRNQAQWIRMRVHRTDLWALSSHARVSLESHSSTSVKTCTYEKVTKHTESDCEHKEQLYEHCHHMQECHWNCFLQPQQDHLCPKKSKNSK